MTGIGSGNQQKRASRTTPSAKAAQTRTDLILTFGLAAMITGFFNAGGDFLKGRQREGEQRCSIAQQFVLDEIPSPALNTAQRSRLNALAVHRMEQCLGDMK
jgi:hypothetical protein